MKKIQSNQILTFPNDIRIVIDGSGKIVEFSGCGARTAMKLLVEATEESLIEDLLAKPNVEALFPRKCDVTGKGMHEGFVVYDEMYIAEEADLVAELRKYYSDMGRPEVAQRYKDDAVRELAYEEDVFFYTEWLLDDEVDDEHFYVQLKSGEVVFYDDVE